MCKYVLTLIIDNHIMILPKQETGWYMVVKYDKMLSKKNKCESKKEINMRNNWGNYTQSSVERVGDNIVFISYYTPCVIIMGNGNVIRTKERFSRTTGKQISMFYNAYNVDRNKVLEIKAIDFKDLLKRNGYNGETGWLR
jgi:hypothetical protein